MTPEEWRRIQSTSRQSVTEARTLARAPTPEIDPERLEELLSQEED